MNMSLLDRGGLLYDLHDVRKGASKNIGGIMIVAVMAPGEGRWLRADGTPDG